MEAKMIITPKIQHHVEKAVLGLEHGIITLSLHIRAGHLSRHIICREESFIDSEELSTHNDYELKRDLNRIKNLTRNDR
jgi:hypothetical protein